MNIGFEAKRFFTNNTGLGNYSRFIIRALSTLYPDNGYYLFTPRDPAHADTGDILKNKNIKVLTPPRRYKYLRATSVWRTWGISREPAIGDLQVFHGLSQELPVGLPARIKKIITVHDLIFYRYPEFYKAIDAAIYRKKLKFACDHADTIIAISEQTKADLQRFLNVDESKITIVYQGAHPNFKRKATDAEIEATSARYQLPTEYMLSVGTIERRKNLMVLVRAMALIPKEKRLPLVVLGRPTEYFKEVMTTARELKVSDCIYLPQHVPFHDFPAIYQGARLFIYPSLFEGFGIPLVEAIESGIPVITSSGSCFREAAGPSALFIDPHDDEALADAIMRVLQDPSLAKAMVEASYAYIQQFEPGVIGEKIMNVYRQ